jgi:elongation factor G
MATAETKRIRNVVLLGHGGSGKTSLAEAMLYLCGENDRLGKVIDGTGMCDSDPEEIARKCSISSKVASMTWKDTKFNILDTPGYLDFAGEVQSALRVADSAIIVMDAKAGIEVGCEMAWERATAQGLPKALFINKFDDNEARFAKVLDALHDRFGKKICPITIPMVRDGVVVGAIDLVDMEAHVFDQNGHHSIDMIPQESKEAAEKYREMLLEAIASTDEALMAKYFDGQDISHMEAVNAVHEGIIHGDIVPVFCGAATKLWGVWTMMDKISESFPRHTAKKEEALADGSKTAIDVEGEPSIFIYKTVADPFVGKMSFFKVMNGTLKKDATLVNAKTGESEKLSHIYTVCTKKKTEVDELACGDIGMVPKLNKAQTNDTLGANAYAPIVFPTPYYGKSVAPAGKGDEGKISQAIAKMLEEDATLRYENNAQTKQQLVYGLGEMHLAVLAAKLKSLFGVEVKYDSIKIPYRETITKPVDAEGKHKKQNGGSGQYGHVKIRFAPTEEEGLTFTVSVVGGTVPKQYNPAVEKGLREAMAKGAYGYPLTRLAADLYDGSYHDVDSDEMSFALAASLAYKKCLENGAPVLLEPVGELTITVPENLVGDIMGELNKRRGSVLGMDAAEKAGYTTITATAPLSELLDYPIALRAMTRGLGSYDFTVTGYDAVPHQLIAKITAQ